MLYDYYSGYSSAMRKDTQKCTGAEAGYCSPRYLWTSTDSGSYVRNARLTSGAWHSDTMEKNYAYSVRCISNL